MTERTHVLDNPVWAAATGAHTHLVEVNGQAVRYHPDVAPLAALRRDPDERAWADLTAIAASGDVVGLAGVTATPPPHWLETWDRDLSGLDEVQLRARLVLAQERELSSNRSPGRNVKARRDWRRRREAVEFEMRERGLL